MLFIYPLLLSLIPAYLIYLGNKIQFKFVYPTWIILFLVLGILSYIIYLLTKNREKAAITMAAISIIFFYFQPVFVQIGSICYSLGIVQTKTTLQYSPYFPLLIFFVWTALWIAAAARVLRSTSLTQLINKFLIVVTVILTISSVYMIGLKLKYIRSSKEPYETIAEKSKQLIQHGGLGYGQEGAEINQAPDIYYLIFDAFAGQDILENYYNTNISEFVFQLEERGFYIPQESRSNYSQTILSLSSSLNITYLDDVSDLMGESDDWGPLVNLIQDSTVANFLSEEGYKTLTFSSGYWVTEGMLSDKKYAPLISPNEYQEALLLNTPLVYLYPDLLYGLHRDRVNYALNELGNIEPEEDPIFIFAHIFAPHPPFVFDQNGNSIRPPRSFTRYDANGFMNRGGTQEEYIEMFSGELNYLLNQILVVVDQLLAQSNTPPVIIIQGDHGPGSMVNQSSIENTNLNERLSIMNAYYFPGLDYSTLYPSITPVNSFRVVFNKYFQANLNLVPDRSYFSVGGKPYQIVDVTKMVE